MIPVARPIIGSEEQEAVAAVLASGHLAHGAETEAFEREFAARIGARHGVAVSNGTAALELALEAMGIGPGDEVLVPAFTFVATANAVLSVGAVPVFVDIEPDTYTMDPADARRATTTRTRLLLPVHLYGLPADMDALAALGLPILEDAAQAHGAAVRKRSVGSIGAAGCFSFYPTKNMTTGEGGMITTGDADLAARMRSVRNHGRGEAAPGTYDHVRHGHNMRMTDVHAAIGRVQLRHLDAWNERRRANAAALARALARSGITPPFVPEGRTHVFHQFTVRVPRRDAVAASMREAGVGVGVYYPKALYAYPHLAGLARRCPQAEAAAREVLCLPVHPSLSDADLDVVADALAAAL